MFRKETSRELKPMDNLKPQKVKSGRSKSRSGARTASSKNNTDKENKNEPNTSHQHLMDSEGMKGRKAITVVTMNLSGQSVMGLTPAYKINYIRDFLQSLPDVVFIQDSIQEDDLSQVLKAVSEDKYKFQLQTVPTQKEGRNSPLPPPPMTGIAWHSDKYFGTPLELSDERLGKLADWVQHHNITVVKLDSTSKMGYEDVYPSFIAIAWHGRDYEIPLRDRTKEVKDFIDFIITLRSNNWSIPILVGGDFNMDMKSYDISEHPELLFVPYRPLSGKNLRDFKNTFLFTLDNLQITETQYKQFHPEIFSSPWVVIKMKGRIQIHMWAVVRIQRCFRRFVKRKQEHVQAKKKMATTKERWKKKIEGEDYQEPTPPPPEPAAPPKPPRERTRDEKLQDEEDYMRRRRKSFSESDETDFVKDFYQKQVPAKGSDTGGHRRRRFGDLKSVQERKKEEKQIDSWLNM